MNILHADFYTIQKMIAEQLGLQCTNFKSEAESQEYSASIFQVNNARIIFRVAKITPTKIGQFVTLWKRIGKGLIMPFDRDDQFDYFMVGVRNANHIGVFIFPKSLLLSKNIISQYGKGGKRAIRVYPSWDIPDSKQAQATQKWQLLYFYHIEADKKYDAATVQKLFSLFA